VVLVAALCGVAFVAWRKREPLRPVLELLVGALLIVGALGLMPVLLWKSGGLPMWKTLKNWANTCRVATLTLEDGSTHSAVFTFKK
jgi:hypothetical protein